MNNGSNDSPDLKLPEEFFQTVRRVGADFSAHVLWIRVSDQRMISFKCGDPKKGDTPDYRPTAAPYVVSTSKFGVGQKENSYQTPLGLHRIAEKIGAGAPPGTIFKGRKAVGNTADGHPSALITDRILWLDGLEPGFNRGGNVDSYRRYIYIHGTGDQTTIGRPHTHGCTHVATDDLIPLFDILPVDTLVFITEK